jgi:hypothetical protein
LSKTPPVSFEPSPSAMSSLLGCVDVL